jgi:hypothetical protein
MAPKKRTGEGDSVVEALAGVQAALQDLFILQARLAGMKKSSVRAIVGVADARVSRIWREIGGVSED